MAASYELLHQSSLPEAIHLYDAIVNIIAETSLDLVIKLGFVYDVKIYSSRFMIIFNPSDLQLVS